MNQNNVKLDERQTEVVLCDSNSLVIAGAGTGKTFTIANKVNYLIENNICSPKNILIISFTNASVEDISNKINYDVDIMTFHKLAIKILKTCNYQYSLCNEELLKYTIDEHLETISIKEQKFILKFTKYRQTFTEFKKSNHYIFFKKFIFSFINLYKTNNLNAKKILNQRLSIIEKNILLIIFKIYKDYIKEKESVQKLDFDDLIIKATEKVKYSKIKYEYIIIDEFQDTSQIRLNLIKELYAYNNAKIVVVGDDWQSIYHFSGCDLNIFLNFTKYFPNTKKFQLLNTYRNSQELIIIASKFICKNPLQIKKDLLSNKLFPHPIILTPYKNKKDILKKLLNVLIKEEKDIMILFRNNNDIYEYITNDFTLENNTLMYQNCKIKYYTIHKSKGLEANTVIILNCNNDYLGFPNKIENNNLINKIMPNDEIIYAEERRLFYVALTRCKEKTYLVYNKNNPSIFIKEIKKIIKDTLHKIKYF